jgi:hypothetical protein
MTVGHRTGPRKEVASDLISQSPREVNLIAPKESPKYASRLAVLMRGLTKPTLGVLRYALTLALFCVVWWYDARYLNRLFDVNLSVIKGASGLIDGSGKVEAMLRAFAAEKMLLFGEGSGLIWLVGKGLKYVFGRLVARSSPGKPETTLGRPPVSLQARQR